MSGSHVHTHAHADGRAHGHGRVQVRVPASERAQVPEPHSSPVLDIGGEVGALVVYLAARPPSGELEACPVDRPAARFHTGVHRRSIGFGSPGSVAMAWTAVFPEVAEGSYHLLDPDGSPMVRVSVAGGAVHQLDLR
jgi:hypothetical protein